MRIIILPFSLLRVEFFSSDKDIETFVAWSSSTSFKFFGSMILQEPYKNLETIRKKEVLSNKCSVWANRSIYYSIANSSFTTVYTNSEQLCVTNMICRYKNTLLTYLQVNSSLVFTSHNTIACIIQWFWFNVTTKAQKINFGVL